MDTSDQSSDEKIELRVEKAQSEIANLRAEIARQKELLREKKENEKAIKRLLQDEKNSAIGKNRLVKLRTAYLMKLRGDTYKKIGAHFGVSSCSARNYIGRAERWMASHMRKSNVSSDDIANITSVIVGQAASGVWWLYPGSIITEAMLEEHPHPWTWVNLQLSNKCAMKSLSSIKEALVTKYLRHPTESNFPEET